MTPMSASTPLAILDDLKRGQSATVKDVIADGPLGQRLMDLGFFPGAQVTMLRNAPLKDPVVLRLDEFEVSIRHEEARFVEVESA